MPTQDLLLHRRLLCSAALGAALTLPGAALAQQRKSRDDDDDDDDREKHRRSRRDTRRHDRDDDRNERRRRARDDDDDDDKRRRRRSRDDDHDSDDDDDDDNRRRNNRNARSTRDNRSHNHTTPRHQSRAPQQGIGPGRNLHRGDRLPAAYRHHQYVVTDWRGHNLSAPPPGQQWVQVGGDYALIAIATGLITALALSGS